MKNDKTKLNQLYRMSKTFEDHPQVKNHFFNLNKFVREKIISLYHKGYIKLGNITICNDINWGRTYDYAVLSSTPGLDFNNKIICDLGCRNGYWGIYLSQFAKRVDISDYFTEWNTGMIDGLNTFEQEKEHTQKILNNMDNQKAELNVHHQDITNLTYEDNSYDIVLCTSVIEHMFPQVQDNNNEFIGDIKGMKEMERICKPGGYVLISTDMSPNHKEDLPSNAIKRWVSGTYWYNEKDLFDRIIHSTSLKLVGDYDFSFDNQYNDAIDIFKYNSNSFTISPVILAFKKI
tara:strand:- start:1354 stop:2223 length:870 start_codon:yes stop_codon:yes gene_type:complete